MGEAKRKQRRNFFRFRFPKGRLTALLIIISILSLAAYDFYQRSQRDPLRSFDPARTKGGEEVGLKIIEFMDFQCPHCAMGSRILAEYFQKHPDDIRITIKHFPLGELNSVVSAVYAECAARQDMFWPFHDKLVETQAQWRKLRSVRDYFRTIAGQTGLNVDRLEQCVTNPEVERLVYAEKMLGESNFVVSTPTYFINGEMVAGPQELQEYLENHFE